MAQKEKAVVSLLERLAELEHNQWRQWSEHLASEGIIPEDRVRRWKENCWKPYSELTENQKKLDRKWAKKTMRVFVEWLQEIEEME